MAVILHEEMERVEYPLRRIMNIERLEDGLLVTTTDFDLARNIGEELRLSFNGKLELELGRRAGKLTERRERKQV